MSCDSTISPISPINKLENAPVVKSVTLSPSNFLFSATLGKKDTTIVVSIQAHIENLNEESKAGFYIIDQADFSKVLEGEFSYNKDIEVFASEFNIQTRTTFFEDYTIQVYAYNKNGNGNSFQTPLSITGYSLHSPEILSINSPDSIMRPEEGQIFANFKALVTDSDDDETIENVYLRFIDKSSGEISGSPFNMSDDGKTLGDPTANDLEYTLSLPIPANPESGIVERDFDIEFFAIDKSGLVSDTVKTTFSIRGN